MIRLVLFDIDGTLLHPRGAGRRAFLRAAGEVLGRSVDDAGIEFAGRTDLAIARDLLDRHGPGDLTDQLRGEIFRAYQRHLGDEIASGALGPLCPGVATLLDRLQAEETIRLGLLTGNIEPGARMKLRCHGIDGLFGFGAYGDDAEDRDLLLGIARRRASALYGPAAEAAPGVVVGDTPLDIGCARKGAATAIAVATGLFTSEQLRACHPDRLFEDLSHTDEVVSAILDLTPLPAPPRSRATPRRDD